MLSASSETLFFTVTDDEIAWFENTDGLGTFGAEQVISTSANNARSVHAADVDGDGNLDVLSASQNDNKIAWYPNDATAPLPLVADTLQIGGSWSLQAANVQGIFAVFIFGDAAIDPGVPLGALGAPGCSGYTTGNLGAFFATAINGASTLPVIVPNNPALAGFELTAQSTCASSNALGFSTSNGLRGTAGY